MADALRRAAVAGSWYPGSAAALAAAVDADLTAAGRTPPAPPLDVVAIVAPHAGLRYSGPVAAHAYALLRARPPDLAVLVGPSHFVDFEGVAVSDADGFETPLGVAEIHRDCAAALRAASPMIHVQPSAHAREHSLEMQLPYLLRVAPQAKIVPLVMGRQTAVTARTLGDALGSVLAVFAVGAGRRALLVASTDLSHYHDAATAERLDAVVSGHLARFDEDRLQAALDARPDHACGGGPTVAVMRAARQLGARDAVILHYGHSGDVSGDRTSVVGYLAAALGTLSPADPGARQPPV
jgi:AmmeMemoRadiSam system protein B